MPTSIGRLLADAASRLKSHGLDYPREDAELLLSGLIRRSRVYLLTYPEVKLPDSTCEIYREWVGKRTHHYPIQYLTGVQEFYGREFEVTPAVLVPRPETELLIDASLELLAGNQRPRVLDVGTGSGCIAITLACEISGSTVFATDISSQALKVASRNRKLHRRKNVFFARASTARPFPPGRTRLDLIASNPPYVSPRELEWVSPGVLEYEPREALLAGASGLEIYDEIFQLSRNLLLPSGRLVLEIGYRQAERVLGLAKRLGWKNEAVHQDLAGIDRCLVFRCAGDAPGG